MTRTGLPKDYYPPDLEHVPTALELVRQGLATVEVATGKGDPKIVRIKPEGYELINQAMTRNAAKMRRWHEIDHPATSARELANHN